ncbi:hypothetical protein AVEN_184734-1 [Araneus ventricosus]|uniref:Uncharacterized protein n=1 Tax=Araneus ventricosus TaxID=182803 RepID=A0A4Y2LAC1_ARAVE|nr:hypothetical protein AVEN_184734-1 [Araneus ventricosus]
MLEKRSYGRLISPNTCTYHNLYQLQSIKTINHASSCNNLTSTIHEQKREKERDAKGLEEHRCKISQPETFHRSWHDSVDVLYKQEYDCRYPYKTASISCVRISSEESTTKDCFLFKNREECAVLKKKLNCSHHAQQMTLSKCLI